MAYNNAAIDKDGDVWGKSESNGMWYCLSEPCSKYLLSDLIESYGPLEFVADPTPEELSGE